MPLLAHYCFYKETSFAATVHAFGVENSYNPAQNIEHRLDDESIIVYMDEGGTVTIVYRMELVRAVMGFCPL